MFSKSLAVMVALSLLGLDAAMLFAQCAYNCTAYTLCLQADVECLYCNPVGPEGGCDGVAIDFNPYNTLLQQADYGGNFDIRISNALCYRSRVCVSGPPIAFSICLGNGSSCVDGMPYVCQQCKMNQGIPIEEYVQNIECIPCAL